MQKYLIQFDIDGTLSQCSTNSIAQEVVDALLLAKKKGHKLVISTGRALKQTLALENSGIFDYFVCLTGAIIYDVKSRKFVYKNSNCLDSNYIRPLIEYLKTSGSRWDFKDCNESKTINHGNSRIKKVTIEELEQDLKNNNILQVLAGEDAIDQEIIDRFDKLNFILMPQHYYDILNKGQNKGAAVAYFRETYPEYKIVAIGDSCNDL